jgi:archaellum biogenesis ATPase FlaH
MSVVVKDEADIKKLAGNWEKLAENGVAVPPRLRRITAISDIPRLQECGASEVRYLLKPVLPEGGVVGVTGDSSSGKSTLAFAWAREVRRSGREVLILDRENPINVVTDRLARLGIVDGDFQIWGGWLFDEPTQPDSPIVMSWVRSCLLPSLIIVDSLIAFHGGDENDAKLMREFMARCRKLADLGATVIVIHHTGKAETAKDYRGSSDFKAAIDVGFHVANVSSNNLLDKLHLRCFKSRFGFSGELVYRYAGGKLTRDIDQGAPAKAMTERLTDLLRSNPGISKTNFEARSGELGLGRNSAREFVAAKLLSGAIRKETGKKNSTRLFLAARISDGELLPAD